MAINRGWFKENYQKAKMEAAGLPSFKSVQNNFSYNAETGFKPRSSCRTLGKIISLANGRAFGAWVDLRKGPGFGKVFIHELSPDTAIFVPRGVANGYQTLEPNVTYTYLVNAHWSSEVKYVGVNLFDPDLDIDWPIGLDEAIISDKDAINPMLKDITPMEF